MQILVFWSHDKIKKKERKVEREKREKERGKIRRSVKVTFSINKSSCIEIPGRKIVLSNFQVAAGDYKADIVFIRTHAEHKLPSGIKSTLAREVIIRR